MKGKQIYTLTAVLLVTFLVFIPGTVFSQKSAGTDTLKTAEKTGKEIILGPVVDPHLYYDPYGNDHRIQNGLVLGRGFIGAETTYSQPGSSNYLNLTMGVYDRASADRIFLMGGLSLGRELLLNEAGRLSGETRTEFYLRFGPGIGLAGRGVFDGSEEDRNYYMGVTSNAILGAQFKISRRTAFFVHGGGQVYWFPGLKEIGFMGTPVASFGLQFSITPEMPAVRY